MKYLLKSCAAGMLAVAGTAAFTACSDPAYLTYDSTYTGIYFTRDTLQYSFSVTPIEVKEHVLRVPLQIMGAPVSHDRTIAFELVDDSTDAKVNEQYIIEEALVPADSVIGHINVRILRDGLAGDYSQGYVRYRLGLRLLQNESFTPTLSAKDQMRVIRFDNAVDQPNWLDAYGNKVWQIRDLGVWHPYKFIKMVEYFHAVEEVQPETYKKMVKLYGENLEHIPYGDPYQFRTIFRKYIYGPMYEFFNDEANHDAIVAAYPDFPFDFPNPFA